MTCFCQRQHSNPGPGSQPEWQHPHGTTIGNCHSGLHIRVGPLQQLLPALLQSSDPEHCSPGVLPCLYIRGGQHATMHPDTACRPGVPQGLQAGLLLHVYKPGCQPPSSSAAVKLLPASLSAAFGSKHAARQMHWRGPTLWPAQHLPAGARGCPVCFQRLLWPQSEVDCPQGWAAGRVAKAAVHRHMGEVLVGVAQSRPRRSHFCSFPIIQRSPSLPADVRGSHAPPHVSGPDAQLAEPA